jgi:hypothetical protein
MYIIWKITEKCKEGKFVANPAFPISSVGIVYLNGDITVIYSSHISSKNFRRCCQGDMTVKESYVSRVVERSNETGGVRKANA